MSQKDLMKDWFKEMPQDQPSPEFQVKVMQRVMSEWTLNPNKYQPMITRKGWWTIGLFAFILTGILFMLQPTVASQQAIPTTLLGLDYTKLFEPVARILEKLNNISPAVAIGTLAIIALWFFDQLFVRTFKR